MEPDKFHEIMRNYEARVQLVVDKCVALKRSQIIVNHVKLEDPKLFTDYVELVNNVLSLELKEVPLLPEVATEDEEAITDQDQSAGINQMAKRLFSSQKKRKRKKKKKEEAAAVVEPEEVVESWSEDYKLKPVASYELRGREQRQAALAGDIIELKEIDKEEYQEAARAQC